MFPRESLNEYLYFFYKKNISFYFYLFIQNNNQAVLN